MFLLVAPAGAGPRDDRNKPRRSIGLQNGSPLWNILAIKLPWHGLAWQPLAAATFLIGDVTDAGAGALRLELVFDATLTADGREGAGGTTWWRLIVDRGVDKATAISNSKYGAAKLLT